MGKFGRGSARFFPALDENRNGADEYPHVHGGRDTDSAGGAAQKIFRVVRSAESTSAAVARRGDLRRDWRGVHAVHIFSRHRTWRGGGGDSHLLRVPGNGRHVGKFLSSAATDARRNYCGGAGDDGRVPSGDGRQSDENFGAVGLCAVEFGKRRGVCIQRDFPEAAVRKKNRPVFFDGRRNVSRWAGDVSDSRQAKLVTLPCAGSDLRRGLDNFFRE